MNILLMTSTIAPATNTFLLKVIDPIERLEQYKRSLTFYAQHLNDGTFDRLVFVDNSGHSLQDLIDIASRERISSVTEFIVQG